jgi:hypothetical protein
VFRYSSRSFCFAPPPPIFVEKKNCIGRIRFPVFFFVAARMMN